MVLLKPQPQPQPQPRPQDRRIVKARHRRLWVGAVLLLAVVPLWPQDKKDSPAEEPEAISIYPLGGERGATLNAEIRGNTLDGAYAVWFDAEGVNAQATKLEVVEGAETEPRESSREDSKDKAGEQRLRVLFQIASAAKPGTYFCRVVTPRGVSNAVSFQVNAEPTINEAVEAHNTPDLAQPLLFPLIVNGRIDKQGELDYYKFQITSPAALTFEVVSRVGEPELTLYEPTGSWFDSNRLTRLAVSYEPTSTRNLTNPRLTYDFEKSGRYFVVVGGGGSSAYQLHIRREAPTDVQELDPREWRITAKWQERAFTRRLGKDHLQKLWARTVQTSPSQRSSGTGGGSGQTARLPVLPVHQFSEAPSSGAVTTVKVVEPNDTVEQAREVPIPSLIEGAIEQPGDVDIFQFKVSSGQRLVFEIETPQKEPPLFNPRLGVFDKDGSEFLTNVYKRSGRGGISYVKTVEPKTVYTFELTGTYWLQIQDATSRYGDPGFLYRVLLRPWIPRVGELRLHEDRVNLVRGEAKKLRVTTEQEEGFSGDIAVSVEGLPAGVETFPASEVEPDRGPPLDEGEKERFRAKSNTVAVLLVARADAELTSMPRRIRLVAQPVIGGVVGKALLVAEIPIMVVDRAAKGPQRLN